MDDRERESQESAGSKTVVNSRTVMMARSPAIDSAAASPSPANQDREQCWQLLSEAFAESHFDQDDSAKPNGFRATDTDLACDEDGATLPITNVASDDAGDGRPPQTARPANVASARFVPLSHLGAGGFGVVVRARDTKLGREVAIKMMRPSLGRFPNIVKRFLREARAVAVLNHPGIVQVYETGVIGGSQFIVAELVEGPSLSAWHKEHPEPMRPRAAAWLLRETALAVHFAHSRGVLHRDLKPSNILLSSVSPDESEGFGYRPRITDFGLAKRFNAGDVETEDLSIDNPLMGTLRYMSPEQASGRSADVTITSDVFSLGVILYEMLTGRVPFDGESDFQTIERICRSEPIRPRKHKPGLSRDLEAIVLKCLKKTPGDRYASAGALADDLNRYLSGQPITAEPPTAFRAVVAWGVTYPRQALSAIGVAILLLVAFVVSASSLWRERRAHAEAEQSLKMMQDALFDIAERISDGTTLSRDELRQLLSHSIEVTRRYQALNPDNDAVTHRLSVLHHYMANACFHSQRPEEGVDHRLECLRLLEELLKKGTERRSIYLYQKFMACHLLISECALAQRSGWEEQQQFMAVSAKVSLETLLRENPDNVVYRDAYNSLRLAELQNYDGTELWKQTAADVVDDAKQLYEGHRDQPLLAKHAVTGEQYLATAAYVDQRFDDGLGHITEARMLFNQVFAENLKDDWSREQLLRLMRMEVDVLLAKGDIDGACRAIRERWPATAAALTSHSTPANLNSTLFDFLTKAADAFHRVGDESTKAEFLAAAEQHKPASGP